ncbi:MAG: hypothetical protein ABSG17_06325 [Spirochaetia bacterium]|jgi:septum formation topological specificity factor MinE
MTNVRFVRRFSSERAQKLRTEALFRNNLRPESERGDVFPAIRDNEIHFYHKGGNLFKYSNSFTTNIKYATVIGNKTKDYVSENDLQGMPLIQSFSEGYAKIKANCKLYNENKESSSVAVLYHKYSCVLAHQDIVVLDIEIALPGLDKENEQDRIDFLLFNTLKGTLRFYEAKRLENFKRTQLEVVEQVKRYQKQLSQRRDEILEAYKNYVKIENDLFDLDLPDPVSLDPKVCLFVFEFDKTTVPNKRLFSGINYYRIGNVGNVEIGNMWNEISCG